MKANNSGKSELIQRWSSLKLKIHNSSKEKPFKEAEVWWCNFGENIGVEVNGKNAPFSRPAIVLKKHNKHSFMAIPLTSQPHTGNWYVEFEFRGKKSWANLAQAKSLSAKRLYRRMGMTTKGDFLKVKLGFYGLYCGDLEKIIPSDQ